MRFEAPSGLEPLDDIGARRTRTRAAADRYECLRELRGKGPAFTEVDGPLATPCWIWRGCLNSRGYPVRGTKEERYLVHRRVIEERDRVELPDGLESHHACEQKRCVNPAHLRAVAPLDHAAQHSDTRTRILAALREQPVAVTPQFIATRLELAKSTVNVALVRAFERGEVERPERGRYAIRRPAA